MIVGGGIWLTALVEPAFAHLWRAWLAQRPQQVLTDPEAQRAPQQTDALLACILGLTAA